MGGCQASICFLPYFLACLGLNGSYHFLPFPGQKANGSKCNQRLRLSARPAGALCPALGGRPLLRLWLGTSELRTSQLQPKRIDLIQPFGFPSLVYQKKKATQKVNFFSWVPKGRLSIGTPAESARLLDSTVGVFGISMDPFGNREGCWVTDL